MALPFILGVAAGSAAVLAFNNRKTIAKKVVSSAGATKEFAKGGLDKAKNLTTDVKDTICATTECIKDKKDEIKAQRVEEIEKKEENE
jgi:hypothetical protein